jgi:hypothetical protein
MFEVPGSWILFGRARGIEEYHMTNVAVVADHLAGIALVLAIVTTETTRRYEVTDVVWMSLPISLHLREEVGLVDSLNLCDGSVN